MGTVPKYVRGRMREHGLKRMYVAQFQCRPDAKAPLGTVPRNSVAGLNTHDMRPFAGFWKEFDIDDQLELALLNEKHAQKDRLRRRYLKRALLEHFQEKPTGSEKFGSSQPGGERDEIGRASCRERG